MSKRGPGSRRRQHRRVRLAHGMSAFATAAFMAVPAGAAAGTASVSGNDVEYNALPRERNAVVFSVSDAPTRLVTVRDSAGVVPGPRCARPNPADRTVAICAPVLSGGADVGLAANLGEADDTVLVSGPFGIDADGGPGADTLAGGSGIDELDGGEGRDALNGHGGDDRLRGGDGRDTIRGHGGDDELSAGPGGATISGGAGEDRLQGGSGADTLDGGRATDFLSGVGAGDVLRARDGTPDEVYCGRGRDRAAVDDVDFMSSACERRPRGRSGAATVIEPDYRFFGPDFSEGGTNLMIGCPGDGPRRCTGTVTVTRGKTVLGRGPFSIRRDRVDQVRKVKPTKAGKALPTGRPVKATVILVTRDRKGRRVVRRRAGSAEDFPASEFE